MRSTVFWPVLRMLSMLRKEHRATYKGCRWSEDFCILPATHVCIFQELIMSAANNIKEVDLVIYSTDGKCQYINVYQDGADVKGSDFTSITPTQKVQDVINCIRKNYFPTLPE